MHVEDRVSRVQEAWVHHSCREQAARTCCQRPHAGDTHAPVERSRKWRFKSVARLRSPAWS